MCVLAARPCAAYMCMPFSRVLRVVDLSGAQPKGGFWHASEGGRCVTDSTVLESGAGVDQGEVGM